MSSFETGVAIVGTILVVAALAWMRLRDAAEGGGDEVAPGVTSGGAEHSGLATVHALVADSAGVSADISQTSFMGATARVWSFEPRPPEQPAEPLGWVPIVDTTFDGRLSDHELLYLEAVLRDEGIATAFVPWRPLEQFGAQGPQYPTALYVDEARRDDAVEIWSDLLDENPGHTYQVRLADPLLNTPTARMELLVYQSLFAELYRADSATRWLVLGVIVTAALATTTAVASLERVSALQALASGIATSIGLVVPALVLLVIPLALGRLRRGMVDDLERLDRLDPGDEETPAQHE